MGTPMARNLFAAGFPLTVHSRSPGPVDELVRVGRDARVSPAEVARLRATSSITMLPDTRTSSTSLTGAGGVLDGAASGSLVIDMSSIDPGPTAHDGRARSPRTTSRCSTRPSPAVRRGPSRARSRSWWAASRARSNARCRCSGAWARTSSTSGRAAPARSRKACNQLVVAATIEAVAEALLLAERSGVDAAKVREALLGRVRRLEDPGGAWSAHARPYVRPGFRIRLHRKDARIVEDAAAAAGSPTPSFAVVARSSCRRRSTTRTTATSTTRACSRAGATKRAADRRPRVA